MHRRTGPAATAALSGLLLVASAGGAGAATPFDTWEEHYDFTFDSVCDLGTADTSDDITVQAHFVGAQYFTARERDGQFFVTVDSTEDSTYTNVDTGIAWTGYAWSHDKDLKVDVVDGIATIHTGAVLHFRVYAPDGAPGGEQNFRSESVIVYDIANDVDLSDENVKFVGHASTQDFCVDAARFTT
ncbi:MAG TPA: hypothetical protein VGK35_02505 [Actinotalea sp.]|jgi:hypothetical protein